MSIHVEGKPFNLPLSHSRLESLRSAGLRRTDRSDQLFAFSTLEEPKQRKLSIKLLKSPENKDQEENLLVQKSFVRRGTEHSGTEVAEELSKLAHPNILKIWRYFLDDGELYLSMDYPRGGTLTEKLVRLRANKRNLTESEVIEHMTQLVSGVKYIHDHNIVHGELKTENIYLEDEINMKMPTPNLLKIANFGIEALIEQVQSGFGIGIEKEGFRKRGLLPPPSAGADGSWTVRAGMGEYENDIECLGRVAYELCTFKKAAYGTRPFSNSDADLRSPGPIRPYSNSNQKMRFGIISEEYDKEDEDRKWDKEPDHSISLADNKVVEVNLKRGGISVAPSPIIPSGNPLMNRRDSDLPENFFGIQDPSHRTLEVMNKNPINSSPRIKSKRYSRELKDLITSMMTIKPDINIVFKKLIELASRNRTVGMPMIANDIGLQVDEEQLKNRGILDESNVLDMTENNLLTSFTVDGIGGQPGHPTNPNNPNNRKEPTDPSSQQLLSPTPREHQIPISMERQRRNTLLWMLLLIFIGLVVLGVFIFVLFDYLNAQKESEKQDDEYEKAKEEYRVLSDEYSNNELKNEELTNEVDQLLSVKEEELGGLETFLEELKVNIPLTEVRIEEADVGIGEAVAERSMLQDLLVTKNVELVITTEEYNEQEQRRLILTITSGDSFFTLREENALLVPVSNINIGVGMNSPIYISHLHNHIIVLSDNSNQIISFDLLERSRITPTTPYTFIGQIRNIWGSGREFFISGVSSNVVLYDVYTGNQEATVSTGHPQTIALTRSGEGLLLTAHPGGVLRLHDKHPLYLHKGDIHVVDPSPIVALLDYDYDRFIVIQEKGVGILTGLDLYLLVGGMDSVLYGGVVVGDGVVVYGQREINGVFNPYALHIIILHPISSSTTHGVYLDLYLGAGNYVESGVSLGTGEVLLMGSDNGDIVTWDLSAGTTTLVGSLGFGALGGIIANLLFTFATLT